MQAPQLAQQDRFRNRPQIEHGLSGADPVPESGRIQCNHIALDGRIQRGGAKVQAQLAQCFSAGSRSGDRRRFAVQANDPRQHMGQHRARQPAALFRPRDDGFQLQPGLRHHRLFREAENAGILSGVAINGQNDMR